MIWIFGIFSLLVLSTYGLVHPLNYSSKYRLYALDVPVPTGFSCTALRGLSTVGEYFTALVRLVKVQASVKKLEGEVGRLCEANTFQPYQKES